MILKLILTVVASHFMWKTAFITIFAPRFWCLYHWHLSPVSDVFLRLIQTITMPMNSSLKSANGYCHEISFHMIKISLKYVPGISTIRETRERRKIKRTSILQIFTMLQFRKTKPKQ